MLIRANCNRALEPIKVIPSRNDGSYVMKSVLGGCIVGPISYRNQSEEKVSGNWTAVMEDGSDKVGRHYFTVGSKVIPNHNVKSMLKKSMNNKQSFTPQCLRNIQFTDA